VRVIGGRTENSTGWSALFLFTNLSRHSSRIALIARRHASL
jgi:hypothetical protein